MQRGCGVGVVSAERVCGIIQRMVLRMGTED